MAIKIQGSTIVDDSRNIINAGSIGIGTTNTSSQLEVVGDVKISGVITATTFIGDGSGLTSVGAALTVGTRTSGVNNNDAVSNVKAIRFGKTPFSVTDLGNGEVLVESESTFNPWYVNGQDTLKATGEEPIEFIAGAGIAITTKAVASAGIGTTFSKAITITATGGGGGGTNYWVSTASGIHTLSAVGIGTTNLTNTLTVGGGTSTRTLYVTGISTFRNGPVLIGSATSTGISSQRLQVTGDAYVSGNAGIGTTNPQFKLHVQGGLLLENISVGSSGFYVNYNLNDPNNLVFGRRALYQTNASSGNKFNVAIGNDSLGALGLQDSGQFNIALGQNALGSLGYYGDQTFANEQPTGGDSNVALGYGSLYYLGYELVDPPAGYTYDNNTAVGRISLFNLLRGSNNIAVGNSSGRGLQYGSNNTIIGVSTVSSTLNNQLLLGAGGVEYIRANTTGVGIGTTNPTSKLDVTGNARFTGIVTATTFVGNLNGYASTAGIATYATNTGTSTSVIGGIASVSTLSVSGVSTFSNTVNFNTNTVNFGSNCSISTTGNSLSIDANTDVYIRGTYGGTKILSQPGANLVFVDAVAGDVSLYYQTGSGSGGSSKRLQTLGTGVTVTGTTFTTDLSVSGNASISGNVTATSFVGDGSGLTGVTAASGIIIRDDGSLIGTASSINFGNNLNVSPLSAGIVTVTGTNYWTQTTTGINTLSNVGIGTTNPTSKLHVVGDAKISGIITATSFIGDGSGLTGIIASGSGGIAIKNNGSVVGTAGTIDFASGLSVSPVSAGVVTVSTNINYVSNSGVSTYASIAGIATYASTAGIATYSSVAGVSTYASTAGIATYATSAGIATYSSLAGVSTYASVAGIATYATSSGIATYASVAGIATYATSSGIATYAITAGVSTSVIGGIGSITQLSVSGITTTATLNVGTGGTVITTTSSGLVGIGTTNPRARLQVGSATTNTTMFVVAANGDVGIGTTNPDHYDGFGVLTLDGYSDVGSATTFGGGNIILKSNGRKFFDLYSLTGATSGISSLTYLSLNRPFQITQGLQYAGGESTSYATIAITDSRVGLGTTRPGAPLHITPTQTSIAGLFSGTTSNDMVRITQIGSGNALVVEDETNPDSSPFVITATGLVGIGTTNPTSKLQVQGDVRVSGVVTASSFSGSGAMQSRTTLIGVTTTIANNGIGNTNITGFKSYTLFKVGLSTAGWLRLYTDNTSRANDVFRSVGEDPAPGSGVIAEVVTTGVSTTQIISPAAIGWNNDNPVANTIYAAVTNLSGLTTSISVNLTVLQLEV